MAVNRIPLGRDCKLYYNSGSYASPTWVLIERAVDVTLVLEAGEAEISSRVSEFELFGHSLKKLQIDFAHFWKTDITAFMAIYDAWWNETPLEFLCLDGLATTAGKKGVRATMLPMKVPLNQALKDKVKVDITLKPTDADNPPAAFTVPA